MAMLRFIVPPVSGRTVAAMLSAGGHGWKATRRQ
jgi:hypothetical protein